MGRREQLILPRRAAAAMLDHARAELPNEACGLIAGDRRTCRATAFHATRNEHASPLRFSVHPEDLVRVVLDIESRGEELLAIFHSHVGGPPKPSPSDVRESVAYPGVLHVVASTLEPGPMRAWRIRDGRADEVGLVIG